MFCARSQGRKIRIAEGAAAVAGLAAASGIAVSALRRAWWKRQPGLSGFRYGRRYSERIRLADGTPALLRMVTPWDKRRLQAGMKSLSPDSRYARFHVGKNSLSPWELRYFTEVDGIDHFAIGAMRAVALGEGLGVARFVRHGNSPESADAAIVIAESARRKGLGRALFTRLMEAARERGIRILVCEVLATNRPMLRLLDSIAPDPERVTEGGTVIVRVAL